MSTITETATYLIFLIPGAIILFVRSRLTAGRLPHPSERILSHLVVSVIYLVLILPFVDYRPELGLNNIHSWN